jgi:hypothetical protein
MKIQFVDLTWLKVTMNLVGFVTLRTIKKGRHMTGLLKLHFYIQKEKESIAYSGTLTSQLSFR